MSIELVNADFSKRVVIETNALPWLPSPQANVERRLLDRIGGEVARATSLVRYAPGSSFPAHEHALGEEYLVLEGVFSDEHGDYPAGTYVRNPPGSRHTPRTGPGSIIFVKLRQMRREDRERIVIDTRSATWRPGGASGHSRLPLYASPGGEVVTLERLDAGTALPLYECIDGEEILVLDGCLADEHGSYDAGCWIRNPTGHGHRIGTNSGAAFWAKRGHLPFA
ncbi:MAG: cupin domain-containing protein [Hyphomicrobiaceae bacterium]|nr:cupin domain-containing protein [Hyphomicrobiaceae bacterium]